MNDVLLSFLAVVAGYLMMIFAKDEATVEIGAFLAVFGGLAFAMSLAASLAKVL